MLFFLRHLGIKGQVLALVAIPIIALVCLFFVQLSQTLHSISSAEILKEQIRISEQRSALVHEMQKERGMSAGFLASKGKKFASELQAQRLLTDKAYKNLSDLFAQSKDLPQSYQAQLNQGLESVSKITQIRTMADDSLLSHSNVTPQVIGYYTTTIAFLLDSVLESTKLIHDATLAKSMVAYVIFLYAKERAGLELLNIQALLKCKKCERYFIQSDIAGILAWRQKSGLILLQQRLTRLKRLRILSLVVLIPL